MQIGWCHDLQKRNHDFKLTIPLLISGPLDLCSDITEIFHRDATERGLGNDVRRGEGYRRRQRVLAPDGKKCPR